MEGRCFNAVGLILDNVKLVTWSCKIGPVEHATTKLRNLPSTNIQKTSLTECTGKGADSVCAAKQRRR